MDAQQKGWLGKLVRLAQRDRRLTLAVSTVALLSVFAVASALPHDAATQSAADALTPALTATPLPSSTPTLPAKKPATKVTALTATPVAQRTTRYRVTPTIVPATATPVATATPSEAQTPLNLSDPTATDASLAATPWWQSLFDIGRKLALVVALIYLAMRGLAAFKNAGFTTSGKRGLVKLGGKPQQFFEQIEEIRLSPQHTLHAVRAGNRIIMLARSGSTLRPLSEDEIGDLEADALPNLAADGFGSQLMSAWAGILPPSRARDDEQVDVAAANAPQSPSDEPHHDDQDSVIDAKWIMVEPEVSPTATPPATDTKPLPTKPGKARPSDRPEPLDEATTREVLWFAEEHGASAAAERYGLTRQRVTAMRARYERARAVRRREQQRVEDRDRAGIARTSPTRTTRVAAPHLPEKPDHPRDGAPDTGFRPLATNANLLSNAYGKPTTTTSPKPAGTPVKKPDVASASDPAADVVATAIAQALASRFGVRVDRPEK